VLYQLTEIRDHVAYLPDAVVDGQMSALSRALLQTHTGLAVQSPETLDGAALLALRHDIEALSDLLAAAYLR